MKKVLLIVILLIINGNLLSQNVLKINSASAEHLSLADYIYIYNDTSSDLTVKQLLKASNDDYTPLIQSGKKNPDGRYWGRLAVQSELKHDITLTFHWFSMSAMRLNYLEAYIVKNDELQKKIEFGYSRPKSELKNTKDWDRFDFLLEKGANYTFYFNIRNPYQFEPTFNIRLVRHENQLLRERDTNLINLFYEGMLWVMILYNLLVFLYNRDRAYLYYSLYMCSSALYTLYFYKYILSSLLTEVPHLNAYFWICSLGLGTVFYWQFIRHFLNTRHILPKRWNTIISGAIIVKLTIVTAFVLTYTLTGNVKKLTGLLNIVIGVETLFSISLVVRLVMTRIKTAYFFMAGAISLWIGFFTSTILYSMGYVNALFFGEAGVILEVLIFSLGLGYRMRLNEREKREAQEGLIIQLRKNEEFQARANHELEQKVKERTAEIMSQQEEIQAQNDKLTETFDKLNGTYKQIKDSITYARRIQNAVLPQRDEFSPFIQEYFIYYKPRDIVSGDFYWVKRVRNKLFVAAVDCTGHGVPGAFLSLLGISFLNEISSKVIATESEMKASEVLEVLREKVKESLKQHGQGNIAAKEAMDMALCIIDKDEMKMHYAGAHNPLYLYRDGKLKEYKGDKMPISFHIKERPFNNHVIDLKKDDVCYVFSDGIIDQFGGAYGDKLKTKRFKTMLNSIVHIPMAKQQILLDHEFNDWKNAYPQLDDILVMGFKI